MRKQQPSSSPSFFRVAFVASVALALSFATIALVACNNDSEDVTAFAGGRNGTGGSTGTSGSSGRSISDGDSSAPPEAPSPPFVRCGVSDDDADAGTDSGTSGTASDASADADASSSPSPSSSNCENPPDDCIDSNWAARYSFGFCQNQTCQWDVSVIRCSKGCFRQVDGGDKCNE